jgi:hypothetical protein
MGELGVGGGPPALGHAIGVASLAMAAPGAMPARSTLWWTPRCARVLPSRK